MTRRLRTHADLDPAAELRRRLIMLERKGRRPRIPFDEWALRVPEPKRGTLDFARFPFQRELYEQGTDDCEVVIKKATQLGISAFGIRWAMYWADQSGLTALYVFPHQRQLADFSASRIRPLLKGSEYLRNRVAEGSTQNQMLKQIGSGYLFLRGSESVADLQSVDADVLVLDEYDILDQRNVPDAERRLGGSDIGLIRRVGVPSLPGFGISELYAQSDRRRWHVRCESCGDRQPITFAENVDVDRMTRICRRCRRPLEVSDGEWVAEFSGRDVRGYHVSRLILPHLNLPGLIRDSRQTAPERRQAFFNKDLGEEYAAEDARLTAEHIHAAQRNYVCPTSPSGDELVTMGVDVASVRSLNVRISEHAASGHKRALLITEVDGFAALDELMERFAVDMCAIDGQPERRLARAFADRFPGRVYMVTYTHGVSSEPQVHDEDRRVTFPRVDVLDEVLDDIRHQRNLLPRYLPPGYLSHLQAVARIVHRDEVGRVRTQYRSNGPDDYLHAEAFDLIARRLCAYRMELTRLQPTLVRLDDVVDFQRTSLAWDDDYSDVVYYPGPPESYDDYSTGFGW